MKRILTDIGLVVIVLLLAVVWYVRACQREIDISGEHIACIECSSNRTELDIARYWFALDNGMTNAPTLDREALAIYVHNSKIFNCPSGGMYSVNPVSKKVACSILPHMINIGGKEQEINQVNNYWQLEYPLDYRSENTWLYEWNESKTGTTLRMAGATIVFNNIYGLGHACGAMRLSGTGLIRSSFGSGKTEVSEIYSNGVFAFKIASHMIQISDHGRILEIDKRSFNLSRDRPRILVEPNGMSYVEPKTTGEPR